MAKERFKLMPAVCIFLRKDDKILLLKRKNTGWEDGCYALAGGGVDGNETVVQAAIREVKEEFGVKLDNNNLEVIHVIHMRGDGGFETINFFLQATKWEGEPVNMEPEKNEKIEWFRIDNLPENTVDVLKHAVEQIKKNIFYSEFGWE